jgi:polyhydroxyalkanoate synthase
MKRDPDAPVQGERASSTVPIGQPGGTACADASAQALDRAAHAIVAAATGGLSPASALLAWTDWYLHMACSPGKWMTLAGQAWRDALAAAGSCTLAGHRGNVADADGQVASNGPGASGCTARLAPDPRFIDPAWDRWPFCAYRAAFERLEAWWREATTGVRGVERHHAALVAFFARQWVDALAPSNFVATNPLVIDAACRSGGMNFLSGAKHWLDDAAALRQPKRPGRSAARATQPFLPGRDVATTPGKVVWQNALCELIQYAPTTEAVAREPVFIVPSWIMKYYILDLQPHDSLVRHLVEAGHTVFMVSWHNPDAHDRDRGLDDYLIDGLFAALAVARERAGGQAVQAVGYCLGGTLLAMAAAWLGGERRTLAKPAAPGLDAGALASVSLLAAQTDFTEPGELGLFIDASELAALDALMWQQGYLDGAQMAATFQLLNARDLIWSRMMSEYLLGRRSKPNDLMSWNADTTRMPYRMHTEYLSRLFLDNDLAEGRYRVGDQTLALSDIRVPMFVVGTERDHVSPWRSVYKVHLQTRQALTFLLTSGGHNAGIVAEPGHRGRYYRVGTRETGAPYQSADAFVAAHAPIEGSWWPCWSEWLRAQATGDVPARRLDASLPDAPGRYVLEA